MRAPFRSGRAQPPEDLHRPGRLRPSRVIGIGVDGADDALTVDHEPGRDGEPPGAVAVTPRQVDAELEIDRAQVVGEREGQAVRLGDLVAEVAQELER
jgi:hypothetical protein